MDERRMCKICNKVFSNGKALGGHMRSHLATLPIPPKNPTQLQRSGASTESELEVEETETDLVCGSSENPKRGSGKAKPTRKRSKRARVKKPESGTELEPVASWVSSEEDVAACLMMLSRDVWRECGSDELGPSRDRVRYRCQTCDKVFGSFQALGGHKTSHRKTKNEFAEAGGGDGRKSSRGKFHECPFCDRVFGSGQALGGHKRSHLLASSTTASNSIGGSGNLVNSAMAEGDLVILDLNLPPPAEDEENSAVSIVQFYESSWQL